MRIGRMTPRLGYCAFRIGGMDDEASRRTQAGLFGAWYRQPFWRFRRTCEPAQITYKSLQGVTSVHWNCGQRFETSETSVLRTSRLKPRLCTASEVRGYILRPIILDYSRQDCY